MVTGTINSHQHSSTEASEKQEIMLINVFNLKNKELSWEKYKQPFMLFFCQEEMKGSSTASLCMCKYIHTAFKITLTDGACVAARQCC